MMTRKQKQELLAKRKARREYMSKYRADKKLADTNAKVKAKKFADASKERCYKSRAKKTERDIAKIGKGKNVPMFETKVIPFKRPKITHKMEDKIATNMETREVSQGAYMGKKFKLLEWQYKAVWGIVNKSMIGVSMGRGNGKTTFFANLACEAIDGEFRVQRGEVDFTASSIGQARTMFNHIKWFIGLDRLLEERLGRKRRFRMVDSPHTLLIEDRTNGTQIIGLGSDPGRAHSRAPSLVLADEPAQWKKGGRRMFNALVTSLGKQIHGKFVALGTMPEDESHWFYEMMNEEDDEDLYRDLYAVPVPKEGEHPYDDFDLDVIRLANPSYDHLAELRKFIDIDMKKARDRGGEHLHRYRALRLNMGTPETEGREMILDVEQWKAALTDDPPRRSGPCFVGFDNGGGTSMTAAAAYWAKTGRLEVYGAYPKIPDLASRGANDGVGRAYKDMHDRGELLIYDGVSTNNTQFFIDFAKKLENEDVQFVTGDEFKKTDIMQAYLMAKLEEEHGWPAIEWRRVGRGEHGAQDVRSFQAEVLEFHLKMSPSTMMRWAIKESIVVRDTNGNPALNKSRKKGRNDGLQATLLAVGAGRRWRLPDEDDETLASFYSKYMQQDKVVHTV